MHHFASLTRTFEHLSQLSYAGIFLLILSSGHPLPVPEGVIFVGLGVLAAHTGHLLNYMAVASLAMIFYDSVLYSLAYGGSSLAAHFSKNIKQSWIERYDDANNKKMLFLVFVSHFVPVWRMVNPVIVGGMKMPWKKFLLYTCISALVYPTFYILVGFFSLDR
jgi:membrane protein DedA with SNARE-associated domain